MPFPGIDDTPSITMGTEMWSPEKLNGFLKYMLIIVSTRTHDTPQPAGYEHDCDGWSIRRRVHVRYDLTDRGIARSLPFLALHGIA
jgi:hypothetical protein